MSSSRIGRFLGILIVITAFVVLSNTLYFEVKFSLMEKGFFCLALALIWFVLFGNSKTAFLPLPLIALVVMMGVSVFQFLQAYIASDFLGTAAVALFAIVIGSSFRLNDVVISIAFGGFLIAVWNIAVLMLGSHSVWSADGKFIGAFTHWTSLGLSLLMGLVGALTANFPWHKLINFLIRTMMIALIVLEILMSDSKTSLLTMIFVFIISFAIFISNKSRLIAVPSYVAIGVAILYFVSNWSIYLSLLNKDSTVTGRTEIWSALQTHLLDHPFTGFGWARLFPINSPLSSYVITGAGFPAFHSHNDLLNWYLTTGIIGLALVILTLFGVFIASAQSLRANKVGAAWLLLAPLEMLFAGTVEITSFQAQGWLVFCLLAATAAAAVTERAPLRGLTYRMKIPIA